MNTNNVFIGVTLNNEELLLYLESPDKMIDLITGKYVDPSNIKINSLVPYTSLKSAKHQLKHMIVRRYEKDRSQKLEVSNIFIGDILQTKNNTSLEKTHPQKITEVYSKTKRKDALLYLLNKKVSFSTLSNIEFYDSEFVDLVTGEKYDNNDINKIGGLFVNPKMRPYLSYVEYNGHIEEKRMVLKKYRERRVK